MVLEAVPNVSEGRDPRVVEAIAAAFGKDVALLGSHSDPDHHRSVFTLVGEDRQLVDALLAGIGEAVRRIDLRRHDGAHPRVGAADVVPLVPLVPTEMERAKAAALALARRVGADLALPVFLYGEVAGGRRPIFFRRGGLEELTRRVEAGEVVPDAGPSSIDTRSGAVLVGARAPLVAYNVVLATDDVSLAREVAAAVRGSSGGMPGLQAIGLRLASTGRVQVSMNIVDLDLAPLHVVFLRVRDEAHSRRVEIESAELVGFVPQRVLDEAREGGVEIPDVDESRSLERVLESRLGR